MANSSAIDHHCKFANNIVFMFQIVNDAKSAPFAPILYKTFMYTPKVSKKTLLLANYAKFANHFLFRTKENGTHKNYSELHKIRTILPPSLQTPQNSCNPHQFLKVPCTQQ